MNHFLKKIATGAAALALGCVATLANAEDRVLWLSIGDSITNEASLDTAIQFADDNNFNSICILTRFRANAYYIPNRDFSTYTNPEPRASGSVDTVQYVIDRAKERGLRVYAAWSVYLVTDGSNTLPAFLDNNWRTWVYNDVIDDAGSDLSDSSYTPDAGFPRAQTTADDSGGLWLDPGVPAANAYLQDVLLDFVENYDVDGVILDRIRFPGDSIPRRNETYGYNPTSLTGYGLGNPAPGSIAFQEARRDAVSDFIESTQAAAHTLKPWLIFGATPIVFSSNDFATLNLVYQDYIEWDDRTIAAGIHTGNQGIMDVIMPQYYRVDPATNATLIDLLENDGSNTMTNMAHNSLFGSFLTDTTGSDLATNIDDSLNADTEDGVGSGIEGYGIFSLVGLGDIATGDTFDRFTELEATNTTNEGTNIISTDARGLTEYTFKAGWDSTPPGASASLTAVVQPDGTVDLSWAAATDAAKYLVFRDTDSTVEPYYENLIDPTVDVTGTTLTDATTASGIMPGDSATYYYSIIPVDSFNNRGAATDSGAVVITPTTVIVEARDSGGVQTVAPTFSTSNPFSITAAKSPNSNLVGSGSLFTSTVGRTASFSPQITDSGLYRVFYIMDGGTSNSNAIANANFTIATNAEALDTTGDVDLAFSVQEFIDDEFLEITTTPLEVSAGAAGSAITLTFEFTANNVGVTPRNRFVMDSAAFVKVGELPAGDTTPPTLDSVVTVTTDPTNGTVAEFTFNFSEPVQNFSDFATDVTASGVTFSGGSIVSIDPSTYTVTVTGISTDGTLTVTANGAGGTEDVANNALAGSPASGSIVIDTSTSVSEWMVLDN